MLSDISAHLDRRVRHVLVVIGLTLALGWPAVAWAQRIHVVAPGHTLGKIARRYHVSIAALCKANGITRRTKLKPGMKLVIPTKGRKGKASTKRGKPGNRSRHHETDDRLGQRGGHSSVDDTPMTAHLVARGHSLAKIARRYRTTITALRQANQLHPGEKLRPGQCLLVPLTRRSPKRLLKRRWPCKPPTIIEKSTGHSRRGTKHVIDKYARRPKRPGIVTLVRGTTTWKGRLVTRRRHKPRPSGMAALRRLMFDRRTGQTHPIHPRLAQVLTKISDHFGGRPIHIVSGYRGPTSNPYTPHSNHLKGRAVDIHIPGVPNEALRDYCHTLERVGVGYYPNSSFVHVDVRNITTHWTDVSRPGERPVYTSVNGRRPTPPDHSAKAHAKEHEHPPVSNDSHKSTREQKTGPQPKPPEASKNKASKVDGQRASGSQTKSRRAVGHRTGR